MKSRGGWLIHDEEPFAWYVMKGVILVHSRCQQACLVAVLFYSIVWPPLLLKEKHGLGHLMILLYILIGMTMHPSNPSSSAFSFL